jgi:hypothetical protein
MWARFPGWLRLWVIVIVALAAYLVVAWAVDPLRPADSGELTSSFFTIAVLTAAFALLIWFGDRQFGGSRQRRLFQQAVRTGQIPDGADLERWRAILGTQLKKERAHPRRLWVQLTILLGIGFVGNVIASISDPGFSIEETVSLLGIFVALGVFVFVTTRPIQRRQRARRARIVELLGLSLPD